MRRFALPLLGLLLPWASSAQEPPTPGSLVAEPSVRALTSLDTRWDLSGHQGVLFAPRAYRPVYLLPVTWTDTVNRRPSSPSPEHTAEDSLVLRSVEAKYQISLKAKFAHRLFGTPASLWGGYTQTSRWQVFNGAASRPFRETNYEPELMVVMPLQADVLGWQLRMGSLALNHESNGRSLPFSRSWNRVIAGLAFERGEWTAELRPWVRLGEAAKDDDNPDIGDHVGRAELLLTRTWGEHGFWLQARHSLRTGSRARGSWQADWVFPVTGALRGYLQVFSGHGESLIDYNLRQNKVGLGVAIAGWK